jgi:thiol:disulfide interchange protein
MNPTRVRYWIAAVKITVIIFGLIWAMAYDWAIASHHDASSSYWIAGLISIFVLVGSIFGMEKLYQKYRD